MVEKIIGSLLFRREEEDGSDVVIPKGRALSLFALEDDEYAVRINCRLRFNLAVYSVRSLQFVFSADGGQ